MKNPIIVALDVSTSERAVELAKGLAPVVGAVKIGSELFTHAGPEIVKKIRATGASVFLDLKFYDIPNTVAKAAASAVRLDVDMITIHTSGGSEMMAAAERSANEIASELGDKPPLVLGVTVLTSFDGIGLAETGLDSDVGKRVARLAQLAVKSVLRGLVCSAVEITFLKPCLPSEIKLITPGIRPEGSKTDDQKRTLTPTEALELGADW